MESIPRPDKRQQSFYRNTPCLDIGIINISYLFVLSDLSCTYYLCADFFYSTRREIIFIRVWDQHMVLSHNTLDMGIVRNVDFGCYHAESEPGRR